MRKTTILLKFSMVNYKLSKPMYVHSFKARFSNFNPMEIGLGSSLLWRAILYRIFGIIIGLDLIEDTNIPFTKLWQLKMSPNTARCPQGGKITLPPQLQTEAFKGVLLYICLNSTSSPRITTHIMGRVKQEKEMMILRKGAW